MGKTSKSIKAFAYLRTSSAANIGEDKDSGRRQLRAIEGFAKRAGIELAGTYHDEAVKGSDPIDTRPGFAEMLEALEANGTKTIIVETANRFARDLMVQEVGFAMLKARGFDLIASDSPTSFLDDTPTARLIRQVLGAISEFEKAMLVAKLKGARDRKRRSGVKVEGRKSIAEQRPDTIELARKLARARPKGGKRSLREIAASLAEAGHTTKAGTPYAPTAVKLMLARAPGRVGSDAAQGEGQ
ncbi:DNA invertase Pin-like site-specific DNA recombinase [Bradyrhizobium sp. S3.14.4]